MQTSILTLMLAFGLPGANSCTAQQQGLPRVGQTPPVATQGEEPTPAVTESEDADEPAEMDADEADDAPGADAEMFEIATTDAEDSGCPEAQSKPDCQAHCEGSGSCNTGSDAMLGRLMQLGGVGHAENLALDGKVQRLTIQPGSTVIIEAKNGKQVVVRSEGLAGGLASTETLSVPTLSGLFASQATKQGQDDRVRELEQRVRELEAQLRERDGHARTTPQPFQLWAPQGQTEAREKAAEERAQVREMHERMSAQARDYAKQARQQAQEMRKQAEQMQKQALEQSELWRAHAWDSQGKDPIKWKAIKVPRAAAAAPSDPDVFVQVPPPQPEPPVAVAPEATPAPGGMAASEPPQAWWSSTPAPNAPRARALRTPRPARSGQSLDAEHAQEMQKMLGDMRRQMDEMREQMQALREELQRAPQRELR